MSPCQANFGPGPPATGSPALADFGPGPPATRTHAHTDSVSSAFVFLLFLSLVYNLAFTGYFALCDLAPASPTAESLIFSCSFIVLVHTKSASHMCSIKADRIVFATLTTLIGLF